MLESFFYALIPMYDTYGQNVTKVLLPDGSFKIYPFPIKTYTRKLLYELHVDPQALAFWTSDHLGYKIHTPLVVDPDFLLIPAKLRHSISKQDGCFGYIYTEAIKTIEDSYVLFTNGISLVTLSKEKYLLRKQKEAHLLSVPFAEHHKRYSFLRQR